MDQMLKRHKQSVAQNINNIDKHDDDKYGGKMQKYENVSTLKGINLVVCFIPGVVGGGKVLIGPKRDKRKRSY